MTILDKQGIFNAYLKLKGGIEKWEPKCNRVHPRLSERRELKCGASHSDMVKVWISEDGNLGSPK